MADQKFKDDPRPECKYGSKCYQKNQDHTKKFKHPPAKLFKIFDMQPKAKRPKLSDSPKKTEELKPKVEQNETEIGTPIRSEMETKNEDDAPITERKSMSPKKTKTPEKILPKVKNNQKEDKVEFHPIPENIPEFIQEKFQVTMPEDFYSFYELYKSSDLVRSFMKSIHLKLVGPFDVLLRQLPVRDNDKDYLLHWRYYYDPPEFQTVVASNKNGFHIGYYRDCPSELPCFVANNDGDECKIVPMGENLFAALFSYAKSNESNSFSFAPKTEFKEFVSKIKEWATAHKFSLDSKTAQMSKRQKNTVAMTYHRAGIVVPVDKKTSVGYRPLIENDSTIKAILKKLTEADCNELKDAARASLQPIITMANIATDECDFGTGLELGIDLFCYGHSSLHNSAKSLLSIAYQMLDRYAFDDIITAHIANRRKGFDLSIANLP
ncbi:histone PARylation factor 1 [Arctopsyche grandis]|uniref:histone PARylation factor 1 n=1 Tax=Arctopsyche grandis TaxID=121162 RepID=UPI00406D841A